MSSAQEYADRICEKYGVELQELPSGDFPSEASIAKMILPPDKLKQWLKDEKQYVKSLREQFGIKPFDKFDKLTINDL